MDGISSLIQIRWIVRFYLMLGLHLNPRCFVELLSFGFRGLGLARINKTKPHVPQARALFTHCNSQNRPERLIRILAIEGLLFSRNTPPSSFSFHLLPYEHEALLTGASA